MARLQQGVAAVLDKVHLQAMDEVLAQVEAAVARLQAAGQ